MQINLRAEEFMRIAQTEGWGERVVIRAARKEDLLQMEWEGEFTKFRRVYANVYQRSIYGQAVIWVAVLPEVGVIGQAMLQLEIVGRPELANGKDRAYFHSFRIRPAFRNTGLGIQVMDFVESNLAQRGFETITLNVVEENAGALRLYKRLGYSITGPDPGRWSFIDPDGQAHQVHEPGWRMAKKLA